MVLLVRKKRPIRAVGTGHGAPARGTGFGSYSNAAGPPSEVIIVTGAGHGAPAHGAGTSTFNPQPVPVEPIRPAVDSTVHVANTAAAVMAACNANWTGWRDIIVDSGTTQVDAAGLGLVDCSNPNKHIMLRFMNNYNFLSTTGANMRFVGAYSASDAVVVAIDGVTGTTTVQCTGLSGPATLAKYPPGTPISVFSWARATGMRSKNRNMGETALVLSVSGNTLLLDRLLWRQVATADQKVATDPQPYSATMHPHISKIISGNVWVEDYRISGVATGTAPGSPDQPNYNLGQGISFEKLIRPVSKRIHAQKFGAQLPAAVFARGINVLNVFGGYTVNPQCSDGPGVAAYGMDLGYKTSDHVVLGNDGALHFTTLRHAVNTTDSGINQDPNTATLAQIDQYGVPGNCHIFGINVDAMRDVPWSMHSPAFAMLVQECSIKGAPAGKPTITLRGKGTRFLNCQISGAWILQDFVECALTNPPTTYIGTGIPDGFWEDGSYIEFDGGKVSFSAQLVQVSDPSKDWSIVKGLRFKGGVVLEMTSSSANIPLNTRDDVFFDDAVIKPKVARSAVMMPLSRPAGQGNNTRAVCGNLKLDLSAYPGTGNLPLVDAPASTSALGLCTVQARPPAVNVTKSGNSAGLSIVDDVPVPPSSITVSLGENSDDDIAGVTTDTYITGTAPTTNNGTSTVLAVKDQSGVNTDFSRTTLIDFVITGLPAGKTFSAAKLRLTQDVANSANPLDVVVHGYELKVAWVRLEATYNIRSTGNPWNVAGARGAGVDITGDPVANTGSKFQISVPASGVAGTVVDSTDFSAYFQTLYNAHATKVTFALESVADGNALAQFRSSRHVSTISRPRLILTYS